MKLTLSQRNALARASKGPLEWYPNGWRAQGDRSVPHWRALPKTIDALERLGFLDVPLENEGLARITIAGRQALINELHRLAGSKPHPDP
jgi:hypothetical protein